MTDRALMDARLGEVERRMAAAGVAEAERGKRIGGYIAAVLEDERSGAWQPFATDVAPTLAIAPSPSPVSVAPVHAPAGADPAARSRSVWSNAATEVNRETAARSDPAIADFQAEVPTEGKPLPPGSAGRSRAAWGAAVQAANADLIRHGGRVGD